MRRVTKRAVASVRLSLVMGSQVGRDNDGKQLSDSKISSQLS